MEGGREGRLQGGRKESVMAINASESERRSNASVVMPTPRHATDLVDGTKPAAPPALHAPPQLWAALVQPLMYWQTLLMHEKSMFTARTIIFLLDYIKMVSSVTNNSRHNLNINKIWVDYLIRWRFG